MTSGGDARPDDDPELVRRLFDANPDGLWLFDDRGVTTWANANMTRILGRGLDELVGTPVRELFDEQGRRDFDANLADMLARGTGAENIEAYFLRPDGTAVWGLISYTPVLDDDGSRMGWLHRVTPYTERKEVHEALVEREQQLATAQRIAHIGSWAWDVAADRVQWSDEMCRIFGVHPGTTPDFETYLWLLHPADREHAAGVIRAAVERSNANSLLTSAHQLKGSALNLGVPRVAAAAARLEALGIAGRTDATEGMLDDLTAEVVIAVSALQQALGKEA